jgi:N-acetylmuramoyl-L-alanine amidase
MLRAAVEENLDVIADRPRVALRAGRFVFLWLRTVWVVALPLGVIVALAVIAQWSVAAPPTPAVALMASPRMRPATAVAPADPEVLSQRFSADALALAVRRVIVDAGHGGSNLGTRSASGLFEKDLTLDIADRVRRLLVERGLDAIPTRTGDDTLSLQERAATANAKRGDIFVSFHLNALQPASARGIETYYLGPSDSPERDALAAAENQHSGYSLADMRAMLDQIYAGARRDESRRLARAVQRALVTRLQKVDPAITNRGVKTAPFIVLVATDMPAILAEVSALSNAAEAEAVGTAQYRQTVSEALVVGIQTFIDQPYAHVSEKDGLQ